MELLNYWSGLQNLEEVLNFTEIVEYRLEENEVVELQAGYLKVVLRYRLIQTLIFIYYYSKIASCRLI